MRLFLALVPPTSVLTALGELEAPLRTALTTIGPITWAPAERRHVTVAFLGEVSEEQLAALVPRVRECTSAAPPLPLALGPVEVLNRRVLVTAVVHGSQGALERLARCCGRAARASNISLERRRFRPHLTLARVRGGDRGMEKALTQAAAAFPVASPLAWTAHELVLFRSYLGPKPRHEVLATMPLAGRRQGDAS